MNIVFVGIENEVNGTIVEMLSDQPDYTVDVYSPAGIYKKAEQIKQEEPDLLIVDLSCYDSKPVELIIDFKKRQLTQAILAVHVYKSTHLIKPLLEAGADGYLPSTTTEGEMLTAIKRISEGQKYPHL